MIKSVSFIGAGNVAEALTKALLSENIRIERIVSRSIERAERLAALTGAIASSELSSSIDSDLLLIAVPDSALPNVINAVRPSSKTIVAHTAGSCSINLLAKGKFDKYGVFYPLQTFTAGREYQMTNVPFLVEGNSNKATEELEMLAGKLSDHVRRLGSESRMKVHLAAVFVCNFVNHMYSAGQEIIAEAGLPFSLLEALIEETMKKAADIGPLQAQTGPAVRNDQSTIKKHLDLLSCSTELSDIYNSVSKSIIKTLDKQV